MKISSLFIPLFIFAAFPWGAQAQVQDHYVHEGAYECTPLEKESLDRGVIAEGTAAPVYTLTYDLNGDGEPEKIAFYSMLPSGSNFRTTVTVEDQKGNAYLIYSNVVRPEQIGTKNVVAVALVDGEPYVRIIEGKNAAYAYDVHYQSKDQFSTCKLKNAVEIREQMIKSFMSNGSK